MKSTNLISYLPIVYCILPIAILYCLLPIEPGWKAQTKCEDLALVTKLG